MHNINSMSFKIKIDFSLMFILFWIEYTVLNWPAVLLRRFFKTNTDYLSIYFPFIILVLCTLLLPKLLRYISAIDCIIALTYFVFWFASKLMHPEFYVFYNSLQSRCFEAFIMLYVAKYAYKEIIKEHKWEEFVNRLYKWSRIGMILLFIYMIVNRTSDTDNMTVAYSYLPSYLVVLYVNLRKTGIINTIEIIAGSILFVLLGNRGSLLIIVVSAAFFIIYNANKTKDKFIVGFVACILSILILVFDIQKLISSIAAFITSLTGVESRTLSYLSSGNFFDANGRDWFAMHMLNAVEQNKFGYGLFADRYIISRQWRSIGLNAYAHNLLYEMWVEFGIYIGTAIIIVIVALFLLSFRSANKYGKILIYIYFASGFIKLFFSSSWIVEPNFFILLGLIVAQLEYRKYNLKHLGLGGGTNEIR